MRTLIGLLIALWIACPGAAFAHRLDEYLQATTITVSDDQIGVRLRLTPGVAVASAVLAEIDTDRNGNLSALEQSAYAQDVTAARVLQIDGRATPLRLRSAVFPTPGSMCAGTGDILLEMLAPAPKGIGPHSVTYRQSTGREPAVFLVNALTPTASDVGVVSQTRSFDQAFYRLDYQRGRAAAAPSPQGLSVVTAFALHGARHILTGYDHLLFVAALAFGAATLWDLLGVITAFTIAHSLTLTVTVLGLVTVPEQMVEPLISASIVFVAAQNLLRPQRTSGFGRFMAAFVFGLVHGLGFAGGLLEVMHGMEQTAVLLAILGFSLGIELGNQLVLLPLLAVLQVFAIAQRRKVIRASALTTVRAVGSATIAVAGAVYLGAALSGTA